MIWLLVTAAYMCLSFGQPSNCNKSMGKPLKKVEIDVVFFEMAPYIYYKNGSMHGALVEMGEKFYKMCNIKYNFKYDAKTVQNFTHILRNHTNYEHLFNNKTQWIPFSHTIDEDVVTQSGLSSGVSSWTHGIEVVMHRHQIALLVKIGAAILDCRHLVSLVLLLTICFGILIWVAVSGYHGDTVFFNCALL